MRTNFPFDDGKPSAVPSPCNGNRAVSNKTGICDGCFRTLREIVDWERASDTDKILIMQKVIKRKPK